MSPLPFTVSQSPWDFFLGRRHFMDIGLLTAPFRNESLEHVIDFAADNGFDIPGLGDIAWGPFIGALRHIGPGHRDRNRSR